MLQTRRSVVKSLHRRALIRGRYYSDNGPPDSFNPNRGQSGDPLKQPPPSGDSSGTESLHAASAGHHEPTHHDHHPTPTNESLGRGFYVAIAGLAATLALYKFSRSSSSDPASAGDSTKQPMITRFIKSFDYYGERFARRNQLHADAVQQAGDDRSLFEGSRGTGHVELKFPEIFNTGSPWNVPAGSGANLDALIEHYKKQNIQTQQDSLARREAREKRAEESGQAHVKEVINDTVETVTDLSRKATRGQ